MIDKSALCEIEKLQKIYENRWGKSLDFSISLLPRTVTQDRLCLILRRIVDTGESCLIGYEKIREISLSYEENIDWSIPYKNGDIFSEPCPFCGKNVSISFYGTYNQSYIIYCETDYCLRITLRGL